MRHDNPFGGVVVIDPVKHADQRGFFSETYNQATLRDQHGIECDFVQDNHSLSVLPGVVRGLHFQAPPMDQAKLVRVVKGSVLDVALDIRRDSPTFGHYFSVKLSDENWKQLYVPSGFAHGFATLEPNTEFLYKVSNPYSPAHEHGILWRDPDLAIDWQLTAEPILSGKDEVLPRLKDLADYFSM